MRLILQIILFLAMICADALVAFLSYQRHTPCGLRLCVTCLSALTVTASYLASIFVEDYFTYSVLSSLYFISVNTTLMALTHFVRRFIVPENNHKANYLWFFLYAWLALDVLILLVNPFVELSIHYVHVNADISHYVYQMYLPYRMHLTLSYVLLAFVFFLLLKKIHSVPSVYRRQYLNVIFVLILVILINAVYLFYPKTDGVQILDYSLLGYSAAAALLYWVCCIYSEKGLVHVLQSHMFSAFDRGILLFNYENDLIMENDKALELLSGLPWGDHPAFSDMEDLLREYGSTGLPGIGEGNGQVSFRCYPTPAFDIPAMACDYQELLSDKREVVGKLFLFSELAGDYDPLTGFYQWDVYKHREGADRREPVVVATCDINGLAEINELQGKEAGDRAVQLLARLMQKSFPPGTAFIRGREAILAAVCHNTDEEAVQDALENMQFSLISEEEKSDTGRFYFQSGLRTSKRGETHADTVRSAMDALRIKKLLDEGSKHSEVLFSLLKMLQACDKDSDAHMRRTQRLGIRLGSRINLSAELQSDFTLLSILHDIGIIGVPIDILNKPARLTDDEWEILTGHAAKGEQIVSGISELKELAEPLRYHHERWDGKGYPDGLSKESIPLLSRMIAVVDAYDAMTNNRPYRRAMSHKTAAVELLRCSGTQFDPMLVAEFLQLLLEQGLIDRIPTGQDAAAREAALASLRERKEWSLAVQEPDEKSALPRVHLMEYSRYVIDETWQVLEIDDAFTKMTGYTEEDVRKGLRQQDLIFEKDREEYFGFLADCIRNAKSNYLEHWIRRKDGSGFYAFCYGRLCSGPAEKPLRGEIVISNGALSYSARSVLEAEQSRSFRRLERWESKFRRDSLTGLLNHEAFRSDIEQAILAGGTHALMLMMDLDHFKDFNDTHGHSAGDKYLMATANALLSALRKDDLACRMGGDEFAAILFYRDESHADVMRERAQQIFEKINRELAGMPEAQSGLSMGAAFLTEEINTFEKLYNAADQALYRAKESGRSQLSF